MSRVKGFAAWKSQQRTFYVGKTDNPEAVVGEKLGKELDGWQEKRENAGTAKGQ